LSLQAFQQAVVELTLSPGKATALRQGDDGVLGDYALTERERERLFDIVRQPGISVSCSLSRGNRFEVIAEAFPMTCILLDPVLRKLLDELWAEQRPTNYQLAGEETAFVCLLREKMEKGELEIEYLPEILEYELACRELARESRTQLDPKTVVEMVVEFQHSPDDLLPPLSRLTAPPAALPQGLYRARVRLQAEDFSVEVLPAPV
jgi:hypothetical protein